ncbi:MAG: hypothetical protein RL268_190 [Pseudomonadota bacterium]|jgi:hypothetical protein
MHRRAATEIAIWLGIVAAIIALAGCTRERPVIVKPPVELLSCQAEPVAPVLPPQDWSSIDVAKAIQAIRDKLTGLWVLDSVKAGQDCRNKVGATRAWAGAL